MKTVTIQGRNNISRLLVGEKLEKLAHHLPKTGKCIIITDGNVLRHHGERFPKADLITIGLGEGSKTLETVRGIYENLIRLNADRSTFLLGIGGGIVCDITGFAASTFMRGLSFGFAATTLLAQVDASVGGKNGVNLYGYKNMIGVFNQPDFVICDPDLLHTLPQSEIRGGLAEIIKHAVIADPDLFDFLEARREQVLNLERETIMRLVHDSVIIKSQVVNQDETEKGRRRILNFGHTLGHAVEKTMGLSHGEAVAFGMTVAATLSVQKGLLSQAACDRIINLIAACGLPVRLTMDLDQVLPALQKDKKRSGESIHFVLLEDIGRAVVLEVGMTELETAIKLEYRNPKFETNSKC